MADGGVEFYDVEANKAVMLFVFNSFKPQRRMDFICRFESFIDPTRFGLRLLQGSKLRSVLQLIILRVKGNFIPKLLNCIA